MFNFIPVNDNIHCSAPAWGHGAWSSPIWHCYTSPARRKNGDTQSPCRHGAAFPQTGRQRCGCSAIPSAVPRVLQPHVMLPAPLQRQLCPRSVPQAQLEPVAPGRLRFIMIQSLKCLYQISWESQEEYLRQKQATWKGTAGYRCSYPCEWKPRNTWNTPDSYDWPANATANTYLCFK